MSGPCLIASNPNVTLTLTSNSTSQTFNIVQRNLSGNSGFTSNQTELVNGVYSIYAQYMRNSSAGSDLISSNTRTNVTLDNSTNPPTLSSPTANTSYSSTIPVTLTLTESYLTGTAKLTFTNNSGNYSNTLTLADNILNQTFTISTGNISSTNIVSKTYSSLPDDTYNVTLSYQDRFYHPVASVVSTNVLIQTITPAPNLTSPSSGYVVSSSTSPVFTYNLPSAPLSGTATLTLTPGYTYSLGNAQSGTYTITSNVPVDGTYSATVSYQDYLGNPLASSSGVSVTFDRTTLAPTISSPITNSVTTGTITFSYNLPEPAASGTKVLTFSQNGTAVTTLSVSDVNTSTLTLNVKSLTSSTSTFTVLSGTDNIPDGTYSVTLSYQDQYSNPESSTSINLTIDSQTLSPSLISPSSGSSYSTAIPVSLTLGEASQANSVKLIFTNVAGSYSNTLILATGTLSQTFTLITSALASSNNVLTSTYPTLPDGMYNVTLSYKDANGNPETSVVNSSVLIQTITPAPSLTSPASGYVVSSSTRPVFTYNLPSAPLSGTATLTLSPGYAYSLGNAQSGTYTITSNVPVDGTYTATVRYQDFLGNPAATSSGVSVTFDRTTLAPIISSPITNSVTTGTITFSYNLPEPAASGTKVLTFSQNGTAVSILYLGTVNASTINLNLKNLTAGPTTFSVLSGTNNIPDGTYSLTYSYQDQYSNPVSSTSINLTIDSQTLSPSLIRPSSGSSYSAAIPVSLTLGEAYQSGSAKLIFTNVAGSYSNTLILATGTLSQTFTLMTNALASSNNVLTSTYPTLPDGIYNVSLSYKDANGNPETSVVNSNVLIQTITPAPNLTSPSSGYVVSSSTRPVFTYNLPSAPLSGTATLTLSPGYVYSLGNAQSGTYTITSNVPVDGTYTATVSYQDYLGNPVVSSSGVSVKFDRITLAPVLNSPTYGSSYSTAIPVSLTLGEAYQSGSAKLIFVNGANQRITLTLMDNALSQTFTLSARNVVNSNVISATQTTIPDDVYNVILQYQDVYGNPVNSVAIANLVIQSMTPTPTITSPSNGAAFDRSRDLVFTYNLPSAPLSGTAVLTISPGYSYPVGNTQVGTYTITSNIPADGNYTATVSYQDFLANPAATSSPISIKIQRNTPSPSIIYPANAANVSSGLIFKGTIPSGVSGGSKKLTFLKNNATVSTIILNNTASDSLYLNLHRLSQLSSSVQSITGLDSLVDGNYTLTYSYQDEYANPVASSSVTFIKDSSPLVGVLSHTSNVVFGTFTETLTFNKPVVEIFANPIIPNLLKNAPSATLGALIPNANKTVYTFQVTPLQAGMIKLQAPFEGIATDISGNKSRIIGIDSIQYVDTTIILKPTVLVGNTTFCQGDSTTLVSSLANSYLWSTGATSRSIIVKQTGTYQVKTAYDNRVKGVSDNITITVKPTPSAPILTRDLSNNLVSSYTSGNKWYKDGSVISDTTQKIKPISGSTYTVRTVQNGCPSPLSSAFVYLITEISNPAVVDFIKLSPNPFVDVLRIDFADSGYQQLNVEVIEISSGLLVASKLGINTGYNLDLGQLHRGTYVVRIVSPDGKIYQQVKVVKM